MKKEKLFEKCAQNKHTFGICTPANVGISKDV